MAIPSWLDQVPGTPRIWPSPTKGTPSPPMQRSRVSSTWHVCQLTGCSCSKFVGHHFMQTLQPLNQASKKYLAEDPRTGLDAFAWWNRSSWASAPRVVGPNGSEDTKQQSVVVMASDHKWYNSQWLTLNHNESHSSRWIMIMNDIVSDGSVRLMVGCGWLILLISHFNFNWFNHPS